MNQYKKYTASVIIPCYNGGPFLREAIDSVQSQSLKNIQVIIVNDGSTDNSLEIMQEYSNSIEIVNQENKGLPAARNAGLKRVKGEFVAFLDADDYWHKDFLSTMVDALDSRLSDLAYCGWQNIGLPGKSGRPYIPPDYGIGKKKVKSLLRDPGWPVHAAVLRADKILQPFDSKWKSCEDFAFWLELVFSLELRRVDKVLAYYRHHNMEQMTKRRDENAIIHWRIQKEFIKNHPEIARVLDRNELREITDGRLMNKGFTCYWDRDIKCARTIFLSVLKTGYGSFKDWKYMLPALLPLKMYEKMIRLVSRHEEELG
jgi:glycosyltransferase involved in cell wall biosynthesis